MPPRHRRPPVVFHIEPSPTPNLNFSATMSALCSARAAPFVPAAAAAARRVQQQPPHCKPAPQQQQSRQQARRSRSGRLSAAQAEANAASERSAGGRPTYRPSTYTELVNDACQAIEAALEDGLTRMEVEFPAVSNIDSEPPPPPPPPLPQPPPVVGCMCARAAAEPAAAHPRGCTM